MTEPFASNVIKTTNPLASKSGTSVTTVMLRIRFPPPSTRATRTFDIDWNLTVEEGMHEIAKQMEGCGLDLLNGKLYIQEKEMYLDPQTQLKTYASTLASVSIIDFVPNPKKSTMEDYTTYLLAGGAVLLLAGITGAVYYKRSQQ